ncbi:MAG: TlpA family protein disulfide reductase, partial [Thermoanaerobaculia bacterium]|nr:TlpA family protein disulfide reductase [Thermoanaerobaculia bacterium]
FVAEKAIEYPVVLDPEGRILLLLETSTVPTTVLLDKNGKVMWYSVGVVQATNPALQAALAKVFAE